MVELYCFVAHAQHIASGAIEGEAFVKEANSVHIASLNVTENQQDGKTDSEDSGRDLEAEDREGTKSTSKER